MDSQRRMMSLVVVMMMWGKVITQRMQRREHMSELMDVT